MSYVYRKGSSRKLAFGKRSKPLSPRYREPNTSLWTIVFTEIPKKLFVWRIFSAHSALLSPYLYRFDFLEVGHGIGMSAEVNVLLLHVLHLTDKVQIVHIRPMERLSEFGVDIVCIKSSPKRYYIGKRPLTPAELKLVADAVGAATFISAPQEQSLVRKLFCFTSVHQAEKLGQGLLENNRSDSGEAIDAAEC